jgi:hypothetical protein
MKRLIVVCEGPTEKEFCKSVLQDFFWKHEILLETPVVKHSGGGVVPWPTLRVQLMNHLRDANAHTTTFIDYYGIKDDFLFPKWDEAKALANHEKRMELLEDAMFQDIPEEMRHRFIPHLQLHEFESLLFADISAFEKNFMPEELDKDKLSKIITEFPNPEDINNSPKTAPSKRLEDAIDGYQKVLFGNCVAMDIGLEKMMDRCPHFCKWINRLTQI